MAWHIPTTKIKNRMATLGKSRLAFLLLLESKSVEAGERTLEMTRCDLETLRYVCDKMRRQKPRDRVNRTVSALHTHPSKANNCVHSKYIFWHSITIRVRIFPLTLCLRADATSPGAYTLQIIIIFLFFPFFGDIDSNVSNTRVDTLAIYDVKWICIFMDFQIEIQFNDIAGSFGLFLCASSQFSNEKRFPGSPVGRCANTPIEPDDVNGMKT